MNLSSLTSCFGIACCLRCRSEQVLRPLLRACAIKDTPKLTIMGLSTLYKLLIYHAIEPAYLPTVVGTLRMQAENEDETVQLKILQTLLPAVAQATLQPQPGGAVVPSSSAPHSHPAGQSSGGSAEPAMAMAGAPSAQDSLFQACRARRPAFSG